MSNNRLTEIEAVNILLATIGSSPVTNLESPQNADVRMASDILRTALREVQAEKWYFNTEDNYPLSADGTGQIYVPINLISIDCLGRYGEHIDAVVRGSRLYDRANHTYTFTGTIYANVLWCLDFNDLPETAKLYVVTKAARRYQEEMLGDPSLRTWTREDEERARGHLVSEDLSQRKVAFGGLPKLDPSIKMDFRDL